MGRTWVAATALLATGCATAVPVQCGGCAGPGYVLNGVPDGLRHAVVTVCLGRGACSTVREREPLRTTYLQPLSLPPGSRWEDVDGASVRVTIRSRGTRWHGSGALHSRPADGSPCDCGSLSGEVRLARVSPPGSPR